MPFPQISFTIASLLIYFLAESTDGRLYRIVTQEDQLGEFLQVAALLYSLHLLWKARSLARKFWPVLALGMAGLFFLAGEEISWGQRLFGFSLPGLQAINTQGETNLHNLLPLHGKVGPYIVVALTMAIFVPYFLSVLSRHLRFNFTKLAVIDSLCAGSLMAVLYWILNPADHVYFYEWSELWIYGVFALQLRALLRGLVDPPRTGPYLFGAMTVALWMNTLTYTPLF